MDTSEKRDLLADWLKLGSEVLERCYPDSEYASLVIPHGEGVPDTVLVVTPQRPSRTPNPQAS